MSFNLKKRRRSAVLPSALPVVISTSSSRTERVQDLLAEAQLEVDAMKVELERKSSDRRAG